MRNTRIRYQPEKVESDAGISYFGKIPFFKKALTGGTGAKYTDIQYIANTARTAAPFDAESIFSQSVSSEKTIVYMRWNSF